MDIFLDGNQYTLDVEELKADLADDECELVTISRVGELVIDNMVHGSDYEYRREVWQMRQPGEGTNNCTWAEHQWEFCRSVKLTETA